MAKERKSAVKRPLTPDELGRAGQAEFGKLCDLGKLIAADSARADRMGWDYHIEVPLDSQRGVEAFDKRHKIPDMKVQVKTIWADNDSVDLDLIAAERLARWEYPSFIVILRLNMDKSFRDSFVIHLLDDNLARILRALREAEAKDARSIKNRQLTFNITAGTKIAINGDALAEALREAIQNDGRDYTVRKRQQLEKLGYGAHRVSGILEFEAISEDEVLNIFIGAQPGKARRIAVDDIRFGVPIPQIRDTGALINVMPRSTGPCQVVISSTAQRKRVRLDAELYFVSLGGTDAPWKMRVTSDLIEIVASRDSPEISFRLGGTKSGVYTIDEIISVSQAMLIMASGPSTFEVRVEGKMFITFQNSRQKKICDPKDLEHMTEFFIGFRDVLAEVGLRDVPLSHDEVADNEDRIRFLIEIQKPNNKISRTITASSLAKAPELSSYREGLLAAKITFSRAVIVFWAHVHISAARSNDSFIIHCTNFVLRDVDTINKETDFIGWAQAASRDTGLDVCVFLERPTFDSVTATLES